MKKRLLFASFVFIFSLLMVSAFSLSDFFSRGGITGNTVATNEGDLIISEVTISSSAGTTCGVAYSDGSTTDACRPKRHCTENIPTDYENYPFETGIQSEWPSSGDKLFYCFKGAGVFTAHSVGYNDLRNDECNINLAVSRRACLAQRYCVARDYKIGFSTEFGGPNTGIYPVMTIHCLGGPGVKMESIHIDQLNAISDGTSGGAVNTLRNYAYRAKAYCESLSEGYITGIQGETSSAGMVSIACLKESLDSNINCIETGDNGNQFSVPGTVNVTDNFGVMISNTDSCNPGGTVLTEYYCNSATDELVSLNFVCDCVEDPGGNGGYCASLIPSICSGENDYFVAGMTGNGTTNFEYLNDTCLDDDTLKEYYCSGDNVVSEDFDCNCKDDSNGNGYCELSGAGDGRVCEAIDIHTVVTRNAGGVVTNIEVFIPDPADSSINLLVTAYGEVQDIIGVDLWDKLDSETGLAFKLLETLVKSRTENEIPGVAGDVPYYCGLDLLWHQMSPTLRNLNCIEARDNCDRDTFRANNPDSDNPYSKDDAGITRTEADAISACLVGEGCPNFVDSSLYPDPFVEIDKSKCLEDYECQSNSCFDDYCISVSEELKTQRGFLLNIWCVIANLPSYLSAEKDGDGVSMDPNYLGCLNNPNPFGGD